MEQFSRLLLDVWREACRHIEIGESVAVIAPVLFKKLPVDLVLVRRIDVGRAMVETVASGRCQPGVDQTANRTQCANGELERLVAWCREQEILHRAANDLAWPPGLLPPGLAGDVMAGPLNGEDGPIGLLVLVASPPHEFRTRHEEIMGLLIEPFTIWLENDRRLRELKKHREAAEADKQTLLSRLGKNDISEMVVGAETGLRTVMERVAQVAHTDVPVLILGETGSGKEVVARAIHSQSRRAAGPILRVNCGAIAPDLVDSELFGHERGSFTGAVGTRKGWFERADGGTLFLDECGELPLSVQVRLLRILQDGTFERVGGEQPIHVDVRIVAATHRDIKAMVADGRFREDLWYRLAVFPIHLPPLRDRIEDIPEMANRFAVRVAKRLGLAPALPTPDEIKLLIAYPWPGNVRELASVIERAAILGDGRGLDVATALGTGGPPPALQPTSRAEPAVAGRPHETGLGTLDSAAVAHIKAALERTRGRIEGPSGAAQVLGINPHTLRARMRKLGIDWKSFRG